MTFRLAEFHRFEGGGCEYVYLVPSAGVFELDDSALAVIARLGQGEATRAELMAIGGDDTVHELHQIGAIVSDANPEAPGPTTLFEPPADFPLQTLVMNLTNQCNLSCQYCYEFGEDKVATPEGKPKFMDYDTARASIDFLMASSIGRRSVHVTFFGGETLMNFPLLKRVVEYATAQAADLGRAIDFSLTTNATLLTPAIIEYLAANRIGVTVSIDGSRESHDKLRVFANGRGSYDVIEPRVRALLREHRTRPIAARVTLTSQAMDVLGTYRHLKHDLGFREVGFAPVTTSPNRLYSINECGLDSVLDQFRTLAGEYLDCALRGEHHGFSNVSDTLAEIHQGVSKSHPCGAALGLAGVGPSGDVSPCHRFVDSDAHRIGHVASGIDRARQADFLARGHIHSKTACSRCWARPLCAGGCHHEAYVRYGDTGHPNLHYCDWIRGWTDTCLQIYGAIAARNPGFLDHFAERKAA
jgi:uncharacterized protein